MGKIRKGKGYCSPGRLQGQLQAKQRRVALGGVMCSLKANNKELVKALDEAKQRARRHEETILKLQKENQELREQNAKYERLIKSQSSLPKVELLLEPLEELALECCATNGSVKMSANVTTTKQQKECNPKTVSQQTTKDKPGFSGRVTSKVPSGKANCEVEIPSSNAVTSKQKKHEKELRKKPAMALRNITNVV